VAVETWLIDTSAYARLNQSPDREKWLERIERGLVSLASVTALEIGYSFTDAKQAQRQLDDGLLGYFVQDYMTPAVENRAREVQLTLLANGTHRAASVADLLVAASAEIYGRRVLHVDRDFDLIAAVTGQQVERLAL
jgi:predicted nucleic acid-binding protein